MDENKPVEEQENNMQSKEYKHVFPIIILFYIAAFIINFLVCMFISATESSINGMEKDILDGTSKHIMTCTVIYSIVATIISFIILLENEYIRKHNKPTKWYYTLMLIIPAVIAWLSLLPACGTLLIGILMIVH